MVKKRVSKAGGEKPLGQLNYESFADRYAQAVVTKPHNALYERPATLSLLPDVSGKHVLDAGCGSGIYSEWLAQHGARVTAVDVTPEMVAIARDRLRHYGIEVRQADLAQPLDWLADSSIDIVLSPLVLDYVAEWHGVLAEFHRVIVPGGLLVFSVPHPMADWRRFRSGAAYFDIELVGIDWTRFGEPFPHVKSYRRPLEAVLNPVIEAGFHIEKILEPRPSAELKAVDPALYEQLLCEPCFLCVRAARSAARFS